MGFDFLIPSNRGEVFVASCVQVEKNLNPLCTASSVMSIALQFYENTSFSKMEVE